MKNQTEVEDESNREKNQQNLNQDTRPEKYSQQRKQERQLIKEDHSEREQHPEETDYSATQIKGLN